MTHRFDRKTGIRVLREPKLTPQIVKGVASRAECSPMMTPQDVASIRLDQRKARVL